MIVYSHNYVTLGDVCRHNNLDYNEVLDAVSSSDISFGTNEDTLISRSQLQDIIDNYLEQDYNKYQIEQTMELDWGRLDDNVLISLGC
jgi:hypothetical protein